MLVEVRVPLEGVGAFGTDAAGVFTPEEEIDWESLVCLVEEVLWLDGFAATVNAASDNPAMHRTTPNKWRRDTEPAFGLGFFFMNISVGVLAGLMGGKVFWGAQEFLSGGFWLQVQKKLR